MATNILYTYSIVVQIGQTSKRTIPIIQGQIDRHYYYCYGEGSVESSGNSGVVVYIVQGKYQVTTSMNNMVQQSKVQNLQTLLVYNKLVSSIIIGLVLMIIMILHSNDLQCQEITINSILQEVSIVWAHQKQSNLEELSMMLVLIILKLQIIQVGI